MAGAALVAERAAVHVAGARNAGLITLAGCGAIALGSSAPWLVRVVFGISVMTSGIWGIVPGLVVLAVVSALVASGTLLRRPTSSWIALGLLVLASTQLCLAIWNAVDVLQAIARDDSRLVVGRAIGTGVYLSLAGVLLTLWGGVL
ncbi:MAG: hypothetical protein ACXWO1_19815, partial [Isosphaeraceae bacterium]